MTGAGYSGTPLLKKLGIKPGMKLMLISQPEDYYGLLEKDVSGLIRKEGEAADLVHLFVKSIKEFEREMKKLKPLIRKNTAVIIWVSWLKKASGFPTDVTEDRIRQYALENDLVDVKVCALNEVWSGLKLVTPLAKRFNTTR